VAPLGLERRKLHLKKADDEGNLWESSRDVEGRNDLVQGI
jgi:hypothetical protein